jgi:DNA polymerase-1
MDEKKLFLLDAYALIYRAYYALIRAPRVTSKGFNTSAIFGFCNTIDEILRKEKPTHIAVCFDPRGGHTFRHEMYAEYKAQRDAQPEDITLSVPYIKDIIRAYNIPVVEVEGFEADDVIGTLSRRAEAEGFTTYMMTPDKDYCQLVTEKVKMYRPALRGMDFEIRGVEQVCERYGIARPAQMIDLLALEGDASDNIPGCPGVGEKTAVKLINEWGSVENLLENVASLKGALKTKVADNVDKIKLSKMLATIRTDVPINLDLESFRRRPEDVAKLRSLYTELEFKSFLQKLGPAAETVPASPSVAIEPSLFDVAPVQTGEPSLFDFDYSTPAADDFVVNEAASFDDVINIVGQARAQGLAAVALYSVGEEAMTAKLYGLAVATTESVSYLSLPDDRAERDRWVDALRELFANESMTIVSHDAKRDYILLKRENIEMRAVCYDTAVAHYILQPEMRHRLWDVAFAYLGKEAPADEPEVRARRQYPAIEVEAVANLLGRRASAILALKPCLERELRQANQQQLFDDIEMPMSRVLAEMELTGVRVDTNQLAELSSKLAEMVGEKERRIYELAGCQFNISSPRQVGEVLFDKLKIDEKMKRTKSGAYSTTEEILEKYRHSHEVVDLILQIRGLNKLLATYINALPELINHATGKIHTTYNQTVTATGRLSSANPNLQNIPVRTDIGREIRRAFIPDEGSILLAADYSQIELRLMADMSADPDMLAAFHSGEDIHRATAAKIYKVAVDDVTDAQRRNAKTANFGIIYGISAFGLSERLSIPRSEAKMLIDGYFESYPHIKDYIDRCVEKARNDGYVTTVMGRRRYLPDINSRNAGLRSFAERNAVNAPLQGSAADIIKLAMIRIYGKIKAEGLASRMIMQVHDELVFNVVPEELPRLQKIVVEEMEGAYSGKVKLEVSCGTGQNWLEAH